MGFNVVIYRVVAKCGQLFRMSVDVLRMPNKRNLFLFEK